MVILSIAQASSKELEFISGENSVPLLELFTSEGCSSCPPAEKWFSQLRQNPALWKGIVPVAFHVDYWNYLGWTDPYSSPEWSARQQEYSRLWRARSIYTPEFVLNGLEWRIGESVSTGSKSGILKLRIRENGAIEASFAPSGISYSSYMLTVAPLACGVSQTVPRGENAGLTLHHDFVARTLLQSPLAIDSSRNLTAHLIIPPEVVTRMDAVAAWVTDGTDPKPIQAAGGWTK